jgi:hypothetical protein
MAGPIKKIKTYDPSTGETTFKASWSSKGSGVSSRPTNRTVAARQASRPTVSRRESAGERIAVAFKSPTAAGVVRNKPEIKSSAKVEAPKKPLTRKETFEIKSKAEAEDLAKRYPGMSVDDARKKKQKEAEKYTKKQAKKTGYQKSTGGDSSSKQKDASSCKNC